MPRYFFHSVDGGVDPDRVGIELRDVRAARAEAVRYAGEVLAVDPEKLWQRGEWRVEVTGEQGLLLFTVVTSAIEAPDVGDTLNLSAKR